MEQHRVGRWARSGVTLRAAVALVLSIMLVGPAAGCGDGAGRTGDVTVFIGDSYTVGTGASSEDRRWSTLVSAAEGWDEVNLGRGGTGYVATAGFDGCGRDFCGSYATRVEEAAQAHPARVVVSGGQNDFRAFSADPAAVRAAVSSTYAALRRASPEAELVVVGPSTTGVVDSTVTSFDAMVRTAAADNHAEYISLLQPPVITRDMVAPDGAHVDDAGHRAIADRIISHHP